MYGLREKNPHVLHKFQNVATQLKPPPSSLANVNQSVISSPPPEAEASGATKDRPVPSASDDNVCKSREHLVESHHDHAQLFASKVSLIR